MNKISVIGLDLAKNVFQIHGIDENGDVISRKQIRRTQMHCFFAKLAPCLIGIEACGGAHYWSRILRSYGHTVKMMAPAFVKPYVKSNKNDRNDAEAICEAVQRPNMRFVAEKSPEQQSILHIHHGRQLLVRQRVSVSNHISSVLHEYGICLPKGHKAIVEKLPEILDDEESQLPILTRHLLSQLKKTYDDFNMQIQDLEVQLKAWHRGNAISQQLASIPGVGLLTATALAAHIGNGKSFKNGRQLSAYLGLVPKQSSSGGKERLLGISKRGDGYLRSLLIHGARSVISHIRRRLKNGKPGGNSWVEQLLVRCHVNEVAVALANKMARVAWVLVIRGEVYAVAPTK